MIDRANRGADVEVGQANAVVQHPTGDQGCSFIHGSICASNKKSTTRGQGDPEKAQNGGLHGLNLLNGDKIN
jgi:hypothetical protein